MWQILGIAFNQSRFTTRSARPFDGETVITGSFNFTKNAEEHNAGNLLAIRDATLAEQYVANWKAHAKHSDAYEGRGGDAAPGERATRRKAA